MEISGMESSVKLPRDEGCTEPLDCLLTAPEVVQEYVTSSQINSDN